MANLATLAASFTELETQKNTVTRAISELEYLKTSKIIAQLSFIVVSVDKNVADVVNLTVSPPEANLSLAKLRNLVMLQWII